MTLLPRNPSWYYSARARPDVAAGRPFRAATIDDESDRTRLFRLADRVFPAFEGYRESGDQDGFWSLTAYEDIVRVNAGA